MKDAEHIEWFHSQSASPTNLSGPLTGPSGANFDLEQVESSFDKVQKHPRRLITIAIAKSFQRHNLTLHDKLCILDFIDGLGKSQKQITEKFST